MTIYSRALEKACDIRPLQGGLHSDNEVPSCLCKKKMKISVYAEVW